MSRLHTIFVILATIAAAACGREPLDWACPDVGPGELILTEIRGPQTGSEAQDWFEFYNASGQELDLYGAQFFIRRLDGSNPRTIIVREPGVMVEAGDYFVLGNAAPGDEPDHVDYGYARDFPVDLYDTAAIDITACGEQIDQVVYRNLPREGTLSFDGAREPSGEANSDAALWCPDVQLSGDSGLVGTPGAPNRECPADDD